MSTIWYSLVHAYAFIAVMPIIPFLLVYFVVIIRGGERKRAIRLAMDVTTAFLIGCVSMLINYRFGSTFGQYFILMIMLIVGGLIGNAQNRTRGKVDASKLIRAVWRLSFFGLAVLYLPLMLLEIIFPTFK